jgi:hypothetical protein
MSDADSARSAKHLGEIAHHLKDIAGAVKALNENMAHTGRMLKEWLELAQEEPALSEVHEDVQKIHDLVGNINAKTMAQESVMNVGETPVVTDDSMPPGSWEMKPNPGNP